MKAGSAMLAAAMLAGCAGPQIVEGPVGLGRTASVGGPHVRPERVIEDSRCPVDVQCVWAGRLIVRVLVSGGNWSKSVDLTLGVPVPVADGMLTLVSATPEKRAGGQQVKASAYRFAFTFQGGR